MPRVGAAPQLPLDPGGGVRPSTDMRLAGGIIERPAHAVEPFGLFGPDIGQKPQAVVGIARIERVRSQPCRATTSKRLIERRQRARPFRTDGQRRIGPAPAQPVAEIVGVMGEPEIEPGAGADLKGRERQAGLPARR